MTTEQIWDNAIDDATRVAVATDRMHNAMELAYWVHNRAKWSAREARRAADLAKEAYDAAPDDKNKKIAAEDADITADRIADYVENAERAADHAWETWTDNAFGSLQPEVAETQAADAEREAQEAIKWAAQAKAEYHAWEAGYDQGDAHDLRDAMTRLAAEYYAEHARTEAEAVAKHGDRDAQEAAEMAAEARDAAKQGDYRGARGLWLTAREAASRSKRNATRTQEENK